MLVGIRQKVQDVGRAVLQRHLGVLAQTYHLDRERNGSEIFYFFFNLQTTKKQKTIKQTGLKPLAVAMRDAAMCMFHKVCLSMVLEKSLRSFKYRTNQFNTQGA